MVQSSFSQTNSEPNKRQIKDITAHVAQRMRANFLSQTVLKDLTTEKLNQNYSGVIILLLSILLMFAMYFPIHLLFKNYLSSNGNKISMSLDCQIHGRFLRLRLILHNSLLICEVE